MKNNLEEKTIEHKKIIEDLTKRVKQLEGYQKPKVPKKHQFDPYVYRYRGVIK